MGFWGLFDFNYKKSMGVNKIAPRFEARSIFWHRPNSRRLSTYHWSATRLEHDREGLYSRRVLYIRPTTRLRRFKKAEEELINDAFGGPTTF